MNIALSISVIFQYRYWNKFKQIQANSKLNTFLHVVCFYYSRLTITYSIKSGGFEDLYENSNKYQTKTFIGPTVTKSVQFKFDRDMPQHCSELSSCGAGTKYPLKIVNDVTKVRSVDGYNRHNLSLIN